MKWLEYKGDDCYAERLRDCEISRAHEIEYAKKRCREQLYLKNYLFYVFWPIYSLNCFCLNLPCIFIKRLAEAHSLIYFSVRIFCIEILDNFYKKNILFFFSTTGSPLPTRPGYEPGFLPPPSGTSTSKVNIYFIIIVFCSMFSCHLLFLSLGRAKWAKASVITTCVSV